MVLSVSITKLHDLATDKIADASPNVNEGEAVCGHPETRLHRLSILIDESESLFEAVLTVFLLKSALGDRLVHRSAIELKQVKGTLK